MRICNTPRSTFSSILYQVKGCIRTLYRFKLFQHSENQRRLNRLGFSLALQSIIVVLYLICCNLSTLSSSEQKWGKVCVNRKITKFFYFAKSIITRGPSSNIPPVRSPIYASDAGLGAILTQHDIRRHEHVISYASKIISDTEKAYSVTEKEALAFVFATYNFHPCLLGNKFTLITDHSALWWLHSIEPKSHLGRWDLVLQEYPFDIVHRSGLAIGNADALSRLPSILPNNSMVAKPY